MSNARKWSAWDYARALLRDTFLWYGVGFGLVMLILYGMKVYWGV